VQARDHARADALHADARNLDGALTEASPIAPGSIDAVITSPPYPNEKDYSRTTRLESVLLGFMTTRKALRQHKKRFIRSNTRGVYKADTDDAWVEDVPRVQELADAIEARRVELGKTSGFERMYHRVVRLYFGGMARHLDALKPLLRPGARLAYVVGDQASYFRIMIRTGNMLASLAERLGYDVLDIDLFRTRFSTATKNDLREEVVVLQWNG
jgi:DNA modification methylase